MKKQMLYIALAGSLTLSMTGQVAAVETFEVAGQKFVVSDTLAKEGKLIQQFEIAGQKFVIREATPGERAAEIAVFEVIPGVDNLIYPDDDPYIVMTGAR